MLELSLPEAPDEQTLADVALAAHALAYVIIANRRFTDLFEWGQRSVRLSLAAEIQHRLLPGAFSCEGGQFTLAAWLEPAGEIAGDSFDFALERDTLHLSMTDAMGHDVAAAVLATLVVGALQNGRRGGVGLVEQAHRADTSLSQHAGRGDYVTGQIARIDLRTGSAAIVNAGHPHPLRLRDGRVDSIELAADLPFGMYPDPKLPACNGCRSGRRPVDVHNRRLAGTQCIQPQSPSSDDRRGRDASARSRAARRIGSASGDRGATSRRCDGDVRRLAWRPAARTEH